MKASDLSSMAISLVGDSGNQIAWDQWSRQNDMSYRFWVFIESDWFKGCIETETELDAIQVFQNNLNRLSCTEINKVHFSAGNGTYEMVLELGNRGNVLVSGTISKSLASGSQLIYEFESHLAEVDSFSKSTVIASRQYW